MLEVGREKKI